MDNRRRRYLVEGECEEKLVHALKIKPSDIYPGKVKKFNVIQEELPRSVLMSIAPGSVVVLVFDTDKEETEHLKNNLKLLKMHCSQVEVMTAVEVLNFEHEIERTTDVKRAQELTQSKSIGDFKAAVNRMKPFDFKQTLKRHKFDISKLWSKTPPKAFRFVRQDGDKVKIGR